MLTISDIDLLASLMRTLRLVLANARNDLDRAFQTTSCLIYNTIVFAAGFGAFTTRTLTTLSLLL